MKSMIAIPARFDSSRFPGKPLAKIDGKTMLERVVDVARKAAKDNDNTEIFVTTDHDDIATHAEDLDVHCILTAKDCKTGSDRVLAALRQLDEWPDFIVNLQGDAPFTPPELISALIDEFQTNRNLEVVTPVYQLSWEDLDRLREHKKQSPFSGTTAVIDKKGRALWFSKNIIPGIRGEEKLREQGETSPVYQHVGLYGYRVDVLEKFCQFEPGIYEDIEGLEQLRLLENGVRIQTVRAPQSAAAIQSGIDTPEDLERAEMILKAAS